MWPRCMAEVRRVVTWRAKSVCARPELCDAVQPRHHCPGSPGTALLQLQLQAAQCLMKAGPNRRAEQNVIEGILPDDRHF